MACMRLAPAASTSQRSAILVLGLYFYLCLRGHVYFILHEIKRIQDKQIGPVGFTDVCAEAAQDVTDMV